MMNIPRPEHPRPDFYRADWVNLNGEWEFHEDYSRSGRARKLYHADAALDKKITVPFCRESVLSGIGDTDFCNCVWYRKKITLPKGWQGGKRVLLHVGACDYKADVWLNGVYLGRHEGYSTPFEVYNPTLFSVIVLIYSPASPIGSTLVKRLGNNSVPEEKSTTPHSPLS